MLILITAVFSINDIDYDDDTDKKKKLVMMVMMLMIINFGLLMI